MSVIALFAWCFIHCLYIGGGQATSYRDPGCGDRQVIVHLFQWKWSSVARECVDFLGPVGFCGVQVSPPNEHAVVTGRPWWERYHQVSYNLTSRSGTEDEFVNMVRTCKEAGVRIFVEAVLNHMAGEHERGTGSAGNEFDADAFEYPGVPYSASNRVNGRHCPAGSVDQGCYALLHLSQEYVQTEISNYLNHLVDIGVAGFRIHNAGDIWPGDLLYIQSKVKNLPEGGRPFFYQDLATFSNNRGSLFGYLKSGYVTEYHYSGRVKRGVTGNMDQLQHIYDTQTMLPSQDAVVYISSHELQRSEDDDALSSSNRKVYKRAAAFMLAHSYGIPVITSSYYFSSSNQGPPQRSDSSIEDVRVDSMGDCDNGWVCEHRWNPVGRMAFFRNVVQGEKVENWRYDHQHGVLSFNRGDKGFFAMGQAEFGFYTYTGLPTGEYCDIISGCQKRVYVEVNGYAFVKPAFEGDPFVALVTRDGQPWNSILGRDAVLPPHAPMHEKDIQKEDYRRTVVLIEKRTVSGESLFIRGGIDVNQRAGCDAIEASSPCSIPIRHLNPGPGSHFYPLKAWSKGDNFLDWHGAESGQGRFKGRKPEGTPTYWSTNDGNHPGYSEFNRYGRHYWVMDVEMDCSRTLGGYFELKAYINDGWEKDLSSGTPCGGDSPGKPPYSGNNHFARCGFVNVFHYNTNDCQIYKMR